MSIYNLEFLPYTKKTVFQIFYMFILKAIPFKKDKIIKNQLWYIDLSQLLLRIYLFVNLLLNLLFQDSKSYKSFASLRNILLNLLINSLFQASKSYKSSTYFERQPIFFATFSVDNPSQVASIYMCFIHICYIPFSICGCLSQEHPVN